MRRCAKKFIKPRIHADETRIQIMALQHEEISEQIIGAAFEVHGILGYGFLEKVYQRAMQVELKATGMSVGLLINFGKQKVEFKRFAYSGESAFHPRASAAKRNNAQSDTGSDA